MSRRSAGQQATSNMSNSPLHPEYKEREEDKVLNSIQPQTIITSAVGYRPLPGIANILAKTYSATNIEEKKQQPASVPDM